MKSLGFLILIGTLIGVILVGWFSPQIISWYYAPPVELSLSCSKAVEWGISIYRKLLIGGAFLGGFTGAIFAVAIWFGRRRKPHPPTPTAVKLPKI